MLKLAGYLKPFTVLILLAVALLFAQAMADLSLPDYMSDIVNKGIQQGGIVNAVPEAIRASRMDKITLFMSPESKSEVIRHYMLIDKSSKDYDKYIKKYPALSAEPVYVAKNMSREEVNALNPIMGKALLAVTDIEKMKSEAKDGVIDFNGTKIPSDTDMYALIAKLPQEQLSAMMEAMEKSITALGDNMIIQSAAVSIRTEYAALGMDTDRIQSSYIIRTGLIMLLITLLAAACTIMVGFLGSRIAAGLSRNLRRDLFSKVESFSNTEFDKFSTASLITRTTNDITQIQMLVLMMIRMVFYAPIMGIGGVIRALGKSSSMSWIIALAVVVLLGLIISVFSIAMPKFRIIQKLIDRLNLVTREELSGMMVIRAFNNQAFEEARFDRANTELTKTNLFINRVMATMFPVMMFIMNSISLLIVWVGAHQIEKSGMQVGDMMAFMIYAMQILFSFLMMSMMFIMIPRASVSAQRVAEVLAVSPVIVDPREPKHFNQESRGIVEFRNVSFRYPGAEEDALKNISFRALPGQTTAFIGSTGSGKTTLVNLIPRFYDVTGGQVLVDNIDVREIPQHELRSKIGYVPQKSSLFSGTIESNIKYGDENASEDDIKSAAEIAQAMEFIKDNPEGFKGEISPGGTNISGGQKQRLSIARALAKKPEIYIFDDSFSALDFRTDAALRKALKTRTENSTVLIVGQRISTIMNSEQIIVLEDGRIAGTGTHKELMETCRTYREIALSQLSKEELA